ncbi:hypothetical protein FACS189440_06900 [Bacteroidia bacterium]|nr:hypothetical protein FACS189440_06900 [Bacteroidia bacterium]
MKPVQKKDFTESNNDLYAFSRDLILNARKLVYNTANFVMVETYWQIGKKIVEEQGGETYSKYGENLLHDVSKRLTAEFGKGFGYVNLTNMRKFYLQFSNVYALRKELNWTHYRSLIRVENPKAREVYMNEAADNSWSTRFLDEQVDKHYYERLLVTHKEAVNELNAENEKQLAMQPQDFILKDPLVLDFYDLQENKKYNESEIEQLLIDLKIGKLTHQDVGQMDMYVRMFDDLKRTEGDNPTIGIILCEEKDRAEVKYSVLNDNEKLFATKYKLYLPSEEELIKEITQIRSLMSGDLDTK